MTISTPSAESSYALSNMTPHVSVAVHGDSHALEKKLHDGPMTPHPHRATHVADIGGRIGWDVPFFGCFQSLLPNCCMSTICPCVSLAQIQSRLDKSYHVSLLSYGSVVFGIALCFALFISHSTAEGMESRNDSMDEDEHESRSKTAAIHEEIFLGLGLVFMLLFAAGLCRTRMNVRAKFEIDGSCSEDCLLATFCGPCTLAQMASQTQSYTPGDCSFLPRTDVLPGYPGTPPSENV